VKFSEGTEEKIKLKSAPGVAFFISE